jgi:peptidoglycan-associated lipoprotein
VALLENSDASVGRVQISTPRGSTQLEKNRQATRFAGPAGETFEVSAEKIKQDFAGALAASPASPVSFLLYFEAAGAQLTPQSEVDLAQILAVVSARKVPDLSVVGHTDTVGEAQGNAMLGLKRAQFVANRIVASQRIAADRVAVESHGEKNLLVATPDNTDEPRNRRVEVTIR